MLTLYDAEQKFVGLYWQGSGRNRFLTIQFVLLKIYFTAPLSVPVGI